MNTRKTHLSRLELALLTIAGAAVTANAYYIHPIIAPIALDFGVSASMIGLVPALNQVALALGIFLLLPLGDRFSNRKLVTAFVIGQFCFISLMAFATDFFWFAVGSTLLGFFTIAPYLLPTYVSKRVDPAQLGHVTAMLTTGVIMGILVARAGSGILGEYLGWRSVYYVASALMLAMAIVLPIIMVEGDAEPESEDVEPFSYIGLLASIGPIVARYPEVIMSAVIQGLNFGLFLSIWLALGLHLTSAEMGYGVDVVGYLALLALVSLFTTPALGKLADRIGARRARLIFSLIQFCGIATFSFFGDNLWLLMLPLMVMNIVGPPIDVTGRMLFLKEPKEIRTRLTTIYIVLMFLGGGLGSWSGTSAYQWGGWQANSILVISVSLLIVMLSAFALKHFGAVKRNA